MNKETQHKIIINNLSIEAGTALKKFSDTIMGKRVVVKDMLDCAGEDGQADYRIIIDDFESNKYRIKLQPLTHSECFLSRLVQYTFEYTFGKFSECVCIENVAENEFEYPENAEDVVKILISKSFYKEEQKLYKEAFETVINLIAGVDSEADEKNVYRLWQADPKSHKPRDKVEFAYKDNLDANYFQPKENDYVYIVTSKLKGELVWTRNFSNNTPERLGKRIEKLQSSLLDPRQFVVLTNYLIGSLYHKDWDDSLFAAPIIVYKRKREKEAYEKGTPKAGQLKTVTMSSELFKEINESPFKNNYDYMVFNPVTGSRMHIDIAHADYGDKGRVVDKDGYPAKKIMMSRYFRTIMGYMDYDIPEVMREEIYHGISKDCELLKDYYERMSELPYYRLKKSCNENDRRKILSAIEERGYNTVHLVRLPKSNHMPLDERLNKKSLKSTLLSFFIGKAEYTLKAGWAGDADDQNDVLRLNSNMMNLVGVADNDKIDLQFGNRGETLRVLEKGDLQDNEIGIPESVKSRLGINELNDVVIVYRNMWHMFKRHATAAFLSIAGTIYSAIKLVPSLLPDEIKNYVDKPLAILIAVPIVALLAGGVIFVTFSEERVKVK